MDNGGFHIGNTCHNMNELYYNTDTLFTTRWLYYYIIDYTIRNKNIFLMIRTTYRYCSIQYTVF